MNRRQFFRVSAGAGALLALRRRAYAFQQSPNNLRKFIIGLPGLGPAGKNEIGQYLPVAAADTTTFPGSDYYRLVAGPYTELLHPDLPKPTKLWGYADNSGNSPVFAYLGGVIVARRGRPTRLTMRNSLPDSHIVPVDQSAFFTDAQTFQNKIAVHLHGGFVPWISDGGPFAWFTPAGGPVGPNGTLQVPGMAMQPGCFNYYYPNAQSARLMWYHDHAHDITRINAYAGLASGYLLTDDAEAGLVNSGVIPSTQIPLIIQDKGFKSQADQWGSPGDLWYPSVYEGVPDDGEPSMLYKDATECTVSNTLPPCGTGRWEHDTTAPNPLPVPSCIPEAFFDTIVVNGAVFPYLSLPAKRFRFRILNGSQARFLNLQIYRTQGDGEVRLLSTREIDPNTGNPVLAPTNPAGPAFIQIGTEGGFLPAPVVFNSGNSNHNSNRVVGFDPDTGNVNRYNLVLAPAERADVIIDFRGFENSTLVLYNDAPAPFPSGDIRNDYFTGAPDLSGIGGAPTPLPGKSPNTRTLMVIRVGRRAADSMDFHDTVNALRRALPDVFASTQPRPLDPSGVSVRQLALYEAFDQFGRLIQQIGPLTGPKFYVDAPTEMPHAGDTEVWQIFNTTGDTHPIHFHLVNVQIISRAPTDGGLDIIGSERPPDANEAGWKETVRMNPNEVIKVITKFDLPPDLPFPVPLSTRTGVSGHEYVYHCHILEHEEHDMMRPLIVLP
jgi:spore coat protein A